LTDDATPSSRKFGPLWLAPGVTPRHVLTKFYAGFVTIGMLTGMTFLQGYILTEHLGIPRADQGRLTGDLQFWTEVVAVILASPFGILSDRVGRRPVMIFGVCMMGIGYLLYPYAESADELLGFRLIFAVGASASATMLGSLANDYPAEQSRGTMIGFGSTMNVIGVMFVALGLSQLPAVLTPRGVDAITAGKIMFGIAALMCLVSAGVFRAGLKGGTPADATERASLKVLMGSGLRAAANPRIALGYAVSFTGRADVVIKGMFLSLWAIHDGHEWGLSPGAAMARFGLVLGFMQGVSLLWQPLFGVMMDRLNRVTAVIIAMAFASSGYMAMGLITSPLDFAMLPAFAVLTIGSSSAIISSIALVGQEAPVRERGAVIGMVGLWGAVGILIFSKAGGVWFDEWGPWAPFVVVGAVQLLLLFIAVLVRLFAPGPSPAARRLKVAAGLGG
jgi:MFS family permease